MINETHAEPGVIIIGAGQAGCEAAFALRTAGYAGSIDLIGREALVPYRRPPLSKQFIANDAAPDSLAIKQLPAYEKAEIALHLGIAVAAIDRAAHRVTLSDGRDLRYGKLILATGGDARRLRLPGHDLKGVLTLRSVDDALAMRAGFAAGRRLVVVGGGFVGLEVAALAVQHGLQVTVLEAAPRLLARVTSPLMSEFYAASHQAAGVRLVLDANVQAFEGADASVEYVICAGERIAADMVLVGVGMQPADELASAAGLAVDQGVLTDAHGGTEDPDIFAIGDCARSWRPSLDQRLRIESVPNAIEQGRGVAQIIAGKPALEPQAPWFWSDQYDLKLQMAGISAGHDAVVVRGTPESRSFLVFYLRDGRVIAADAINRVADFNVAKKLVAERRALEAADLADEKKALKELA